MEHECKVQGQGPTIRIRRFKILFEIPHRDVYSGERKQPELSGTAIAKF
jgi:hypothetical protein